LFFPFFTHRTLHPGKIYPVKKNLKMYFEIGYFLPASFFPFFFFHLIGQRASRDITLSAFNWSNKINIFPKKSYIFDR